MAMIAAVRVAVILKVKKRNRQKSIQNLMKHKPNLNNKNVQEVSKNMMDYQNYNVSIRLRKKRDKNVNKKFPRSRKRD